MLLVLKFKASIIGSLQKPCNFQVSQCIKSKVSDLDYFDLFFFKNVIYFQFQGLYDVIMTS